MTEGTQFRKIYDRYTSHYDDYTRNGAMKDHARTWLQTDTVDSWRHNRMYSALDPLLKADPGAEWLTVGDGRYGSEAHYIMEKGGRAVASDISDALLKEAKEMGFISAYRKENAEHLSVPDLSFDYVVCKESFHHLPRPMMLFYEMARVSRKGFVFIEPRDLSVLESFRDVLGLMLTRSVSAAVRKHRTRHRFESTGNYVYALTEVELEKAAMGLELPTVAFKGMHDAYAKGVEFEKLDRNGPLQRRLKMKIAARNAISRVGVVGYSMLCAVVFKLQPPETVREELRAGRYKVKDLPRNPYS